ncbi:hypothetical protein B0H14DRAFT_2629895 [Mycena olivaceomarginata]|nr:hypothetical protein B0H14DRAFT_2629895 [Mycena olivaceomarginata]
MPNVNLDRFRGVVLTVQSSSRIASLSRRVWFPTHCSYCYAKGKENTSARRPNAYLESVYPEWLEKRPHLRSFWAKVERGWFAKWPVEPGLNLPITTASIEESELSEQDQKRIGDAEEVMKGVIHNWINNRGQKEKKVIASNDPAASTSVPLRELFVALGRKGTRIKQRTELWTIRNRPTLRDALEEEGFAS